MAAKRWKGGAASVAQVDTLTVAGTAASGQTYSVTIGLITLTYTAIAGDTNNSIAAALQAILDAATYGEFAGITWSVANNVITATANTAGTPFVITTAASGTGTLTDANVTANGSPNDFANAKNFDVGAVPVTGDTLTIDYTGYDILYGLNQSAVTLASLTITQAFMAGASGGGTIGLPELNQTGSEAYVEYLPTYLAIGATTCIIGNGNGNGSGRIKIDFGTVQTACTVQNTGSPLEDDLEAVLLKGTHAANVFTIIGGSVAIAGLGSEASDAATLNVGSSAGGAPTLRTGTGCTITTCNIEDGTVILGAAPATLNKVGGSLTILDGNMTALNERGGTTAYLGVGTIAAYLVGSGGTLDFSQDVRGRNVTNGTLYAGGTVTDPMRTVTYGNPITLSQCGLPDVALDFGKNIELAVTYL